MAEINRPVSERKPMEVVDKSAGIVSLRPRNFEELWNFCKMISDTDFVPNALRGKPGAVIAACQYGGEIGLPPMTALKWIAIVNGVPSIWGDGAWMLVNNHPAFEEAEEIESAKTVANGGGKCTIKRKDRKKPVTREFTIKMAETAGLWGGTGDTPEKRGRSVWYKYPGRMLQMRARGLCIKDAIPEALGPLTMREEAEDFIETTATSSSDEPLKTPQAIGGPADETSRENSSVQGARTHGKEVAHDGPDTLADRVDQRVTSPPEDKTTEKEKAKDKIASEQTQFSPRDDYTKRSQSEPSKKDSLLQWLENDATETEILAQENTITKGLKGLESQDQIDVVRAWNARRKAMIERTKP